MLRQCFSFLPAVFSDIGADFSVKYFVEELHRAFLVLFSDEKEARE